MFLFLRPKSKPVGTRIIATASSPSRQQRAEPRPGPPEEGSEVNSKPNPNLDYFPCIISRI